MTHTIHIQARRKTESRIIYRGPSLIDGKPIVAVAVASSRNTKTGNMLQTYILNDNGKSPVQNSKSGRDVSICGNCPHRGKANRDPARKQAKDRTCYVVLGQGPLGVFKALTRNNYPTATGHAEIAAIGKGRKVRVGTYGDPASVPSYVWESLLSEATGHTAYSHQSDCQTADFRPDLFMISADSLNQAQAAWKAGHRTFRVVGDVSDIDKRNEILCPASEEAGKRTTCFKCGLCAGSSKKAKSIAIPAHGPGKGNFAAAA